MGCTPGDWKNSLLIKRFLLLLTRHIETATVEVFVLKSCLALQAIELLVFKVGDRVYLG